MPLVALERILRTARSFFAIQFVSITLANESGPSWSVHLTSFGSFQSLFCCTIVNACLKPMRGNHADVVRGEIRTPTSVLEN